jgi:hypothetical protein
MCGAKTRTGAACQDAPIRGSARCIRHCGPKAAREYRERQRDAFSRGKISAAEWYKAESRRARNRLHDQWKKNPWLPGCTIDLGQHETEFAAAVLSRPRETVELAPAVIDWLRWRYRRLQIDRRDDEGWHSCLVDELPLRVLAAGPAPEMQEQFMLDRSMAIKLAGENDALFSKRRRPDTLRRKKANSWPSVKGRGRPRQRPQSDEERQALALTAYRHHDMLAPLLERCTTQGDQSAVIRALHEYVCDPANAARMRRWHEVVARLR